MINICLKAYRRAKGIQTFISCRSLADNGHKAIQIDVPKFIAWFKGLIRCSHDLFMQITRATTFCIKTMSSPRFVASHLKLAKNVRRNAGSLTQHVRQLRQSKVLCMDGSFQNVQSWFRRLRAVPMGLHKDIHMGRNLLRQTNQTLRRNNLRTAGLNCCGWSFQLLGHLLLGRLLGLPLALATASPLHAAFRHVLKDTDRSVTENPLD